MTMASMASFTLNPTQGNKWTNGGKTWGYEAAQPPRPGPCLNYGFQYALIRNNQSKKIGVKHWALSASNLPWRP